MTIKHLVVTGGSVAGFVIYGILKSLSNYNYYNINNIKSIYATSVGTMISTFLILKYKLTEIDDYLIKRPWHKSIAIKLDNILNISKNKGILDIESIVKLILGPLLTAKDLSESITLKELYNYNNIEFHIYTINISNNIPKLIDLSHKTHPDLELFKAIAMSSAVPIIFSPILYNNEYYIDGGFINNFPLNECILNAEVLGDNTNEILAIQLRQNKKNNNQLSKNNIDNTEIYEYLYYLLWNFSCLIHINDYDYKETNIICCKVDTIHNINNWNKALCDENTRIKLISQGEEQGIQFLKENNMQNTQIDNSDDHDDANDNDNDDNENDDNDNDDDNDDYDNDDDNDDYDNDDDNENDNNICNYKDNLLNNNVNISIPYI
jgi:predicted acylesterase/phospholipase RssA